MDERYQTISFLSDYGTRDEFVGVVHSVIRQIAPSAEVIDVTHEITPFDVRAASLALARAAQYLAPGIVLGVVDPGVGGKRRAVAVEVGNGTSILVGPDNGLLAPAVAMVGGASRAVELTNTEYHFEAPGPTFAGRDIFAPVAAYLSSGVPLEEFGPELDPNLLTPSLIPLPREENGGLEAEVLWIDQYGNVQLNLGPEDLEAHGEAIRVVVGDIERSAYKVSTFSELTTGRLGFLVDSYGLIALVLDQASAAADLGLGDSDAVRIEAFDEANPSHSAPSVKVELRGFGA